jgi:hypothetical protein
MVLAVDNQSAIKWMKAPNARTDIVCETVEFARSREFLSTVAEVASCTAKHGDDLTDSSVRFYMELLGMVMTKSSRLKASFVYEQVLSGWIRPVFCKSAFNRADGGAKALQRLALQRLNIMNGLRGSAAGQKAIRHGKLDKARFG